MRATRLVQIAAEAEGLRFRRRARRAAVRAGYGVVAAVFALLILFLLHVASYEALLIAFQPATWAPVYAAFIMIGVDIVFAGVFGYLASGGKPDPVAEEALTVRKQALAQLGEAVTMMSLLRPLMRYLPRRGVYGLVLATLTARFLGAKGR